MRLNYYYTDQILQSEFHSENFFYKINFNKKVSRISFIFFTVGPFNVFTEVSLPFWLSFIFERFKLVKFIIPKWYEPKWLKKKVYKEIDEENLQIIPRNYIEIIYIMYKNNLNFLQEISNPIIILEELFSIRIDKLITGLLVLHIPIRALKLENVGDIELINFRKILLIQLEAIHFLYSHQI
jgi:hypothetical protein